MSDLVTMSKDEIRALVSEGVDDAFTRLGIQAGDPIEMQKDFQHLREWRTSFEQVKRKGFIAAITVVIGGVLSATWVGIKAVMNG